jgi:periplasmic protein TonB
MAYADQQGMSNGRLVSIALVILLHVFLGYAFVTGLAFEAVKKVTEKLNVVDVQDEKPPEEEPPPPPPDDVLPPPPPAFAVETPSPTPNKSALAKPDPSKKDNPKKYIPCADGSQVEVGSGATCKPAPRIVTCQPSGKVVDLNIEQCPPTPEDKFEQCPDGGPRVNVTKGQTCPEPKKPAFKPVPATPTGNVGGWVTSDDYPSRDLQQENQGSVNVSLTIGANGRVTACSVTKSSGFPGLDSATCSKIKSRAKFKPATDENGQPTTGSYSKSVRWVVPKE